MIRLCLHPPLHLSDHLAYSQRVTAAHCGPVLTQTALWMNMQTDMQARIEAHTCRHNHAAATRPQA